MEKFVNELIENCKKNKSSLVKLKNTAVDCQMFEFAANLKKIELELFPEPQEHLDAKLEADKMNLVFRMVELNIPNSIAWLISETVKLQKKKKGKFSLEDAAKLLAKKHQIFID